MKKTVCALAIGAAALLGCAASAAAAEWPPCKQDDEEVEVFAPYVSHVGQRLQVVLQVEEPEAVANVVVVLVANGETRAVPVAITRYRTTVVIDGGPAADMEALVGAEWDQNLEGPGLETSAYACHGRALQRLSILPVRTSGGDPELPRLDGLYAIHGGNPGRRYHWRWMLTPGCDVFGCRTRLGRTRWVLNPDQAGAYTMRQDLGREQTCETPYRFGDGPIRHKHIHNAWNLTIEYLVQPTRVRDDGVVEAFRGRTDVYLEPTRYAARWNCLPAHLAEPLRGRRLGGK